MKILSFKRDLHKMVKSLKKHYNMCKLGHHLRALGSTVVLEEKIQFFHNFSFYFLYLELNSRPLPCEVNKPLATEIYLYLPFILNQNLTKLLKCS